jgi:hypothetical protein
MPIHWAKWHGDGKEYEVSHTGQLQLKMGQVLILSISTMESIPGYLSLNPVVPVCASLNSVLSLVSNQRLSQPIALPLWISTRRPGLPTFEGHGYYKM